MYSGFRSHAGFVPQSGKQVGQVYDYSVVTPPATTPVTVAELKSQLRIHALNTEEDAYLLIVIKAVTSYFEEYTNRILVNTEFATYRDGFPRCCSSSCIELRRAIVNTSSVSIDYKLDGILVEFPSSEYYVLNSKGYTSIHLNVAKSWPKNADKMLQAVLIKFIAGYGASELSIPSDIKMALMQHATAMYSNRGDCDDSSCASFLPCGAKSVYDKYRVIAMSTFSDCRCA